MEQKHKTLEGKHILVVEDDTFLGELIVNKLQGEGAILKYVSSGATTIHELEKTPFDLILMDILLPGVDGFEVLRQIKANDKFSSIPVVILSNLDSNGDIKKCLELGAARFFNKSVQPLEAVIAALAPLLEPSPTVTK